MPLEINLRGGGGILHTLPLIVYPFTSYGKGLDRHEVSFLIRIYIAIYVDIFESARVASYSLSSGWFSRIRLFTTWIVYATEYSGVNVMYVNSFNSE